MTRFDDLVSQVPSGEFYQVSGEVLPYRTDPYDFVFSTSFNSAQFQVLINDVFYGEYLSDSSGVLTVSAQLEPGDYAIRAFHASSNTSYTNTVSIRTWATWLAGVAELFEGASQLGLDQEALSVYNAVRLSLADSVHIEDSQGKLLTQTNDVNYALEAYRRLLFRLRQSYRLYAGKTAGLRLAGEGITSITPLKVPTAWRPRWILESSLIPDINLRERASGLNPLDDFPLPNLNAAVVNYVYNNLAASVTDLTTGFTQPPSPQTLMLSWPASWSGGTVTIYGTAPGGGSISEALTASPGNRTYTTAVFETVTRITNSVAGSAAHLLDIGLGTSRFVDIVSWQGTNLSAPTYSTLVSYNTNSAGDGVLVLAIGTVLPHRPVVVNGPGLYTLNVSSRYPGQFSSLIDSASAPFDLADGGGSALNNVLWLDVGQRGKLACPLTTSLGSATLANLVTDINAAETADPRYGGATIASVETASTPLGTDYLHLASSSYRYVGGGSSLTVLRGPADAALDILGLPTRRATLNSTPVYGTTTLSVASSSLSDNTQKIRVGRGYSDFTGSLTAYALSTNQAVFSHASLNALPLDNFYGSGADNVAWAGSYPAQPKSAKICLTFTTWGGSAVTLTGKDRDGNTISEVISTTTGTVFSSREFASLSSISHGATGAGSGSVAVGLKLSPYLGDGAVQITSAGTNAGLWPIIDVLSDTQVLIKGSAFTVPATEPAHVWVEGEVLGVSSIVGAAVNLSSGCVFGHSSGDFVEDEEELPTTVYDSESQGSLTVRVDPTLQSGTPPVTDFLTVYSSDAPNGWFVTNGTASYDQGKLTPTRCILTGDGVGDLSFYRKVPEGVLEFAGWPLTLNVWASQHNGAASENILLEASEDGSTWTTLSTTGVTGTTYDDTTGTGALSPTFLTGSYTLAYDASELWIRIRHSGTGSGDVISIDQVDLTAASKGLYLEDGTIVRSDQDSYFGHLVYVWDPDGISESERLALGLPDGSIPYGAPTQFGHIDDLLPFHLTVDRFKLSNVIGVWNYAELDGCTLVGCEAVALYPDKHSYIRPTMLSKVTESLVPSALGIITLSNPTTQEGSYPLNSDGSQLILRDGIPIPKEADSGGITPFTVTSSTTLTLDATEYSASSDYEVRYTTPLSITTPILDFGASASTDLWLAFAALERRVETALVNYETSIPLQFDSQYVAKVPEIILDVNSVTRDDGTQEIELSPSAWSVEDDYSIRLSPNEFDPGYLYRLNYVSRNPKFERQCNYRLEWRGAALEVDVPSTAWSTIEIDDPLDNTLRFNQFRLTLYDVFTLDDVKIYGIGARLVDLTTAPGIS